MLLSPSQHNWDRDQDFKSQHSSGYQGPGRGEGRSRTSNPSMPHGTPPCQSPPSRARRSFPACSVLPTSPLLANQSVSCVLVQEVGGATAPAERELVRGLEGFVPKWRSAATASPSLRSGTRGGGGKKRAAGLGSRRARRRAAHKPTRSDLAAAGQNGVGSLQSHRVPGGSAEPGLRGMGVGGGWARAEGAGVGKANGDQAPSSEGRRTAPGSLRELNGCRHSRGLRRGLR